MFESGNTIAVTLMGLTHPSHVMKISLTRNEYPPITKLRFAACANSAFACRKSPCLEPRWRVGRKCVLEVHADPGAHVRPVEVGILDEEYEEEKQEILMW